LTDSGFAFEIFTTFAQRSISCASILHKWGQRNVFAARPFLAPTQYIETGCLRL